MIAQEHRNLAVLAGSQALFMTSATMIILLGGLAGLELLEDKTLSTLPVAAVMLGNGLAMIPASLLIAKIV